MAVEGIRACGRYGAKRATQAREWLDGMALLPLDDAILDAASRLEPFRLRSLDALHLATALSVRDDVGAFFSYDKRLGEAARECGFDVVQPGDGLV